VGYVRGGQAEESQRRLLKRVVKPEEFKPVSILKKNFLRNMSRKVFDEQRTFLVSKENASGKHMVTVLLDLIHGPHLIKYADYCSLTQYAQETPALDWSNTRGRQLSSASSG
jgi:hypothetical protein